MTAKEMFEELGYTMIYKKETSIRYIKNIQGEKYTIEIWKNSKYEPCLIRKQCLLRGSIVNYFSEEIKAIQKQVEELGWNNES